MCWAAEILMVRENCVAFIFVWSVDAGTFFTDAECYATSFILNWCYIFIDDCRLMTRMTEVTTRTTDDHESQRGEDLLTTQVTTREVLLTTQVTTLDDIFTTHVTTRDDILTTLHDDQEMTEN